MVHMLKLPATAGQRPRLPCNVAAIGDQLDSAVMNFTTAELAIAGGVNAGDAAAIRHVMTAGLKALADVSAELDRLRGCSKFDPGGEGP